MDHHLNFMQYTWQNHSEPFVVGFHTRKICAAIDYAMELYRDGKSSAWVITVPFRHGKALEVNTLIPTPDGFKKIKDLNPGDYVYGEDGKPVRIIAKSPVWKNRKLIKVTADRDEVIYCDEKHLWKCKCDLRQREYKVYEAGILAAHGNTRCVKMPEPLFGEYRKLLIPPYLLGLWLGDGNSRNSRITAGEEDKQNEIKYINELGYNTHSVASCPADYHVEGLHVQLKKLNLLGNKHIPVEYLRASYQQRFELLQGLIDTDGYVSKSRFRKGKDSELTGGQVTFVNINKKLAEDVQELVRTLGVKCSLTTFRTKLYGKDCGEGYKVCFYLKDCAKFQRKAERTRNAIKFVNRNLVFEKTDLTGDTVCIQVENADGMFLCGKSFIPTHNSEILSRKLPAHFLGLFPDSKVILCGHTQALTEGFSKTSRNLISTPEFKKLFPNLRVDPSSSSGAHWNIKDHEGECFASGLLGSLSGQGYNLGLLDDFCRNRADAESETMREKMWDAFTNDFMTRKAPVSITIVLATPWHVDDIIGRIKKKVKDDPDFPRFNFLSFPAISEDYRDGVLFPERFGKQWYTQQKAVLGDYGFQSLMQLEPVKRSGNMLNTECIQRHLSMSDWPKNLRWMRVWDLAHTAKERAKPDPDWTSGTLMAFNVIEDVPHLWIRNVTRMRKSAPERDEAIRNVTKQDGPYVRIGVGNSSDAKDTIATMRDIFKGKYTILSVPEKKDKVVRATPLEAIFKAGNVHVVQGEPWLDDWIAEISAFPYGPHDDQVDNLSAGYAIWNSSGASTSLYSW
jgi:predicted phage terminase large subunit-like protein